VVDGRTVLVSAGRDGAIARWDAATLAPVGSPWETAGSTPIERLALSPDGRLVVAGHLGGAIDLWSAPQGRVVGHFAPPAGGDKLNFTALGFSADSRWLAAALAADDGALNRIVADVSDPEHPGPFSERFGDHSDAIVAFASGRNGRPWLASASRDGTLLFWPPSALQHADTKERAFERRISMPGRLRMSALDISANGAWAVVGGQDGVIQLWDVSSQGSLTGARFDGHVAGDITALAIAADGDFFVSAVDREILVWPGAKRWSRIACNKLGRNMSLEEWQAWVSPTEPYREQCPGLPRAGATRTTN